jgi:hypothetical protein
VKLNKRENYSCRALIVSPRVTIEDTLGDECICLDLTACGGPRVFQPRMPLQFRKPQNSSLSANWICLGVPCVEDS